MTQSINREMRLPHPRERVWDNIANREALADWLFPNDFEPRRGHRFTFQVPGNPKVNFSGLTVRCEVLECDPPSRLVFTWSAETLVDTRVSFVLEPDGAGTRLLFEHSGFDVSLPGITQAYRGAEYGWAKMLGTLVAQVDGRSTQ